MSAILPINGHIMDYPWGGYNFIPQLLNKTFLPQQVCAEYWLGVHASGPAMISPTTKPLHDYLTKNQWSLNFLLKVLDVKDMLSIQVHPDPTQATIGFERENQLGIPLTAKHRNYKDPNHKPELMVALSDFWLLHGFNTTENICKHLEKHPFLRPIADQLHLLGLRKTFALLLDEEAEIIKTVHAALHDNFIDAPQLQDKSTPDFWVQRWLQRNPSVSKGILAIYFLNIIKVTTGQGVFQPAGMLHAYLEGQNIELMANSDNVLRAGLTPKHMDVEELLNIGEITPSNPSNFYAQAKKRDNGEEEFLTPFDEFVLSQFSYASKQTFQWYANSCEILLCTHGSGHIKNEFGESIPFTMGDAFFVTPKQRLDLVFADTGGKVFKARNGKPID